MHQIDIEIVGRIHGVSYRTMLIRIAESLNLKGFVESKEDAFRIVAQGSKENLDELLSWAQKGTMFSRIDGMSYKFSDKVEKEYKNFKVRLNKAFIKDKIKGIAKLGKGVADEVMHKKMPPKAPKHIVIIPDGNRRWARMRKWKPWVGHLALTKNKSKFMDLFKAAKKMGVDYVTFWAFSTENWQRDDEEVQTLMKMMRDFHESFLLDAKKNGIRFRHVGRKDRLPEDILKNIQILEEETKDNKVLNVQFGLDYGGRDELVRAVNKMVEKGETEINEEVISRYLDTGLDIPDPDLIIRTGGNQRTSGIMMWQAHYAELYFTNVLFPDFSEEHLRLAIWDYAYRTRRFGGDSLEDMKNIDLDKLQVPDDAELRNLALG